MVSSVLRHPVSTNFQSQLGQHLSPHPCPLQQGGQHQTCHKHRSHCHSLHSILHSSSCIMFGPVNFFPQTCDRLCHGESWLRAQSFSDTVWWLLSFSGTDDNNNVHLVRFCETEACVYKAFRPMSQTQKALTKYQLSLSLSSWKETNLACAPAVSGIRMLSFLIYTY